MEWIAEIDTLIFSGGGVRGIVFVGALEELQQQYPGVLSQLKHVAGTSIGAIMALLLACRIELPRIKSLFCSSLWNDLYQEIDLSGLFFHLGMLDSMKTIWPSVVQFLRSPEETFAELKQRTGVNLLVCVTNVDTKRYEYHSAELTPLYEVAKSVVASCALPVIFSPVVIHKRRYVDGGVLNNTPVSDFLHLRRTLILRIVNASPLVGGNGSASANTLEHSHPRILDHLSDIMYAMADFIEDEQMKQIPSEFRNHVLTFSFDRSSGSPTSFTFSLSERQRNEICETGRQTMRTFLKSPNIIVAEILTSFIMNYATVAKVIPSPVQPLVPSEPEPDDGIIMVVGCGEQPQLP